MSLCQSSLVRVDSFHPSLKNKSGIQTPDFSQSIRFSSTGDTDMGGKKPKNILSKGIFYGHIEPL